MGAAESIFKVQPKTKSLIYSWRLVTARADRFDTFSRPIFRRDGKIIASFFSEMGDRTTSNFVRT